MKAVKISQENQSMKPTRSFLYFLVASIGLLVAGCSSISPSSMEEIDGIGQKLVGDMPLPKGAKLDNNQSLIIGSGANWTGRIVIHTPQGPTKTFSFFLDQFPIAGWTGLSSIKSKTSVLVFIKQERMVTVEISESGLLSSGAVVSLTASAKGGNNTAPQDASRASR